MIVDDKEKRVYLLEVQKLCKLSDAALAKFANLRDQFFACYADILKLANSDAKHMGLTLAQITMSEFLLRNKAMMPEFLYDQVMSHAQEFVKSAEVQNGRSLAS